MIDDVISLLTDKSRASNPGGVRPRRIDWIRHRPLWPLLVSLPMWATLVIGFLIPLPELWLVTGLLAPFNWFYWSRVKTHFGQGDANPGFVVSADPPLMAVATDLSRGDGDFPVVKVSKLNLSLIDGQPLKVGQRLATVSLYAPPRTDEVPYWSDFDPLPVQYANSRPEVVEMVMDTFEPEEWQTLKSAVRRISRPVRPGLFLLGWDGKFTNRGERC